MKIHRQLVSHILISAAVTATPAVWAQAPASAPPQVQIEPLLREAIAAAQGLDLSVSKLTVPPGYKSTSHSHPGETFVYVLSGRILNQIGDEEPRVYEMGEFFFEHANANHAQFENLDKENPATVLIYGIRPEGRN